MKNYREAIGKKIITLRNKKHLTQTQLAHLAGTSQSAINRIEKGNQNLSLDMVAKLSNILGENIISVSSDKKDGFVIEGGKELSGEVSVNTSKNAAVGLLCASLLNSGKTTLKNIAKIEEVFRIIEVLKSIGVKVAWTNNNKDLELAPPKNLKLDNLDLAAARRTRTIIMFLGPLLHKFRAFRLPYAGGCSIGERTVEPHLNALKPFGLNVDAVCNSGFYEAAVEKSAAKDKKIVLIERGDTVTENVLMAAALDPSTTTVVGASPNYMVQDVCFFLEKLGVKIEGIGTTTLKITGVKEINQDVDYYPSEDPIEAISFLSAGIATKSEITVKRVPIEFLEVELEILKDMGQNFHLSAEYLADNGKTRLVDITTKKSELFAPKDKIHPMPFPGLNIDSLPFFSVICATARGRTLIHDWVYENRAIYSTDLSKLNASVQLLDAHRFFISGPTNWRPAELVAPPALRPAVVILLAMLCAPGRSILYNVYPIDRGYEDFSARLRSLGANIQPVE
jgi:UDP-N-acetylglucosamine 1-carboxyvinyltransferase